MADTERIFVSTTPGLERALELEARALGNVEPVDGGLELSGAPGLHRRANLELRSASRVALVLARFPARELKAQLAQVRWSDFVPRGEKLTLEAHSEDRRTPISQLRESIPSSWPLAREGTHAARLRAAQGAVTLSLDSSGELLYRRGYRQETSHAPLRETLAAGLLQLAEYDRSKPLWDPMCGSGTFGIEAAWMALDRAPGLAMTFGFERWPSHDARAWNEEKARAEARIHKSLAAPIRMSDLNAGALGVARRNARRANVAELIQFERFDATVPRELGIQPGLVIANLPYGKRVGSDRELDTLYMNFAKALQASARGWRVAWLAADAKLLDSVPIAWRARHAIDNGGIRCTFAIGELG